MIPKVALIWINYNSSHIINVVKNSLRSLFEVNYPSKGYEVIVIDNASSDDSWKVVKELVKIYSRRYGVKAIFYRTSRNLMYTGGNEVGLRLISKDVNYVGFINNDVIVEPDSVIKLIEYLSTYEFIGAAQGVLYYDSRRRYVNSAGLFIDTLLNCHMVTTRINKPISVSYTHGAYSIYSLRAIKNSLHNGRLFFQCVPAFFDDNYVGIKMWNSGFMACALPINAGIHLHSGTFKKLSLLREINSLKSLVVKKVVIKQRYPSLQSIYVTKELLLKVKYLGLSNVLRTYAEARDCGNFIVKCLETKLSIEEIPHVPLSLDEVVKVILGAGRSVYARFVDGNYLLSRACLKDLCPQ